MPMQPRPMVETSRPFLPINRFSMMLFPLNPPRLRVPTGGTGRVLFEARPDIRSSGLYWRGPDAHGLPAWRGARPRWRRPDEPARHSGASGGAAYGSGAV